MVGDGNRALIYKPQSTTTNAGGCLVVCVCCVCFTSVFTGWALILHCQSCFVQLAIHYACNTWLMNDDNIIGITKRYGHRGAGRVACGMSNKKEAASLQQPTMQP